MKLLIVGPVLRSFWVTMCIQTTNVCNVHTSNINRLERNRKMKWLSSLHLQILSILLLFLFIISIHSVDGPFS